MLIKNLAHCFVGFWSEFKNVEFSVSDVISVNVQNISLLVFFAVFLKFFWEEPNIKFFSVFYHFSWIYEIKNFWMIKTYLNISDVINENKYKTYANCGLHVKFWEFFVNVILYYDEKGSFKVKVVTSASVPFKCKCLLTRVCLFIVLYHFIINFSKPNSTCCLKRANVSWKCYYIEIIINIIMPVVLSILI